MPAVLRRFTVDELDRFPDDGNRYELVEGLLLVTPAPGHPHQSVAATLMVRLGGALQDEPEVAMWSPGVVRVPPGLHLEPDLLVGGRPTGPKWEDVPAHWLAVEISGRSSRVYDREYKRDAFLAAGVPEVWLIDLASRTVEVSTRRGRDTIAPDGTLVWTSPAGIRIPIPVADLFGAMPWRDG